MTPKINNMKKTTPRKKQPKPTPKPKQSRNKEREQERLERAIRFSQKNREERKAKGEDEPEKKGSNRERKHAYYQEKVKPKKTRERSQPPTKKWKPVKPEEALFTSDTVRLNKYLAHCGVAARRKADEIIEQGLVQVNGKVVTEMGYRLTPKDKVTYKGKVILPVRHVYILLNKPKDYITSVSDERNRKTVMDLIAKATNERVYPVGRLDRNTTGLLLLTNDGDLALALSHPSKEVEKVYEVELDRGLAREDFEKIRKGLELEDGPAPVDEIAYPDKGNMRIVGVALHIGRNRIVRRIFEHLGYKVERLDRTVYAGLTKKDLPRSRWRHLSSREIMMLKNHAKG